ncbi:SIGNAL peptide protein [Flavobacterium cyanobacteriorum]|uniref:SIGNAL peptide protein n=1 Tax=Flavobacterium cyanobacteriorum TaxID=2022802 RepID=A0A255YWS3_9FLAO|nr:DUF2147 domain-containing protein [Flavobacterium cyanobacteriorum]OYQ33134.1 SIGNAL peptide protein [Flavobacterium cyanobacteriorum]
MKTFMICLLLLSNSLVTTDKTAEAILGEWMSPEKDAHILIYKKNTRFYGKIVWGSGNEQKDIHNPNPKLRNRDLIGLIILNDFEYSSSNTWSNGTIYDPREGKTYSCKMNLESADRLKIRGYVGISLFGRTETWTRIK